jgi:hypothetical protein
MISSGFSTNPTSDFTPSSHPGERWERWQIFEKISSSDLGTFTEKKFAKYNGYNFIQCTSIVKSVCFPPILGSRKRVYVSSYSRF